MYSDENGVQFAQSMLYNYQKELWEFDWVMCQKADGSTEICPTAEMTDMGNALSELGYRFMITKDFFVRSVLLQTDIVFTEAENGK